jgi:hypothetical protein
VPKFSKYPFIFGKKNCKNLGVGQNLIELAKILMLESLNIYIYIKQGYYENFDNI